MTTTLVAISLGYPVAAESPEITHVWKCPHCDNDAAFIGIDDHGYGGPDECESDCDPEEGCTCETELKQPFTVEDGEPYDYQAFTGGGYDAEIGNYTRIYCAKCERLLWVDLSDEVAVAAAIEEG